MRLFFVCFAVLLASACHAANPGFSSFDQVYFTTNNRVVSLRTNLISTNSITTLYVTNLYSSNFFTTNITANTFITSNLFTTNITVNNITVTTNITVAGTNVPTINPTDLYVPYRTGTNSFGDSGLHLPSVGSDNVILDGTLTMGAGTAPTEVPVTLNVPSGHTNWLARLNNGVTNWLHIDHQGRIGIGVTNVFINKDIGIYRAFDSDGNKPAWINIGAGNSWPFNYASEWWAKTSTNDGVMQLSWLTNGSSVTRDHVFSVGSSDGLFYYRTKSNNVTSFEVSGGSGNIYTLGSITFGPGTTNVLYRNANDLVYTNQNAFGTFLKVSSDGSNFASYGANGNVAKITGPAAIYMQATSSADYAVLTTAAFVSGTPGFLSLGTSANQWNSLHLTNQIVWGPGTTNALFRNGTSLVYQNGYVGGTTNEIFALRNGTTNRYVFMSDFPASGANGLNIYGQNGVNSVTFGTKLDGIDAHVTADTGGAVWISPSRQSSGSYAFVTTGFVPDTDGKNIGTITNPWGDSSQTGTHYIYGHRSGTGYTNYSRVEFSHTGTNGLANINSSSANDAGSPRAINFQIGGTNQVRIDSSASAGQTRFWLYDEDNGTMERVTVGAADSGGAGFKLLRIPN